MRGTLLISFRPWTTATWPAGQFWAKLAKSPPGPASRQSTLPTKRIAGEGPGAMPVAVPTIHCAVLVTVVGSAGMPAALAAHGTASRIRNGPKLVVVIGVGLTDPL